MNKIALAIMVTGLLLLTGCGGGNGVSSGGAASAAECTNAPTLGQTTFGGGCFK
jgi:hypothetical protein